MSNESITILETLVADPKFKEAIEALSRDSFDPLQFLEARGVALPDGTEITVEITSKKPDPPDKCVTICVGTGFFKFCYRQCT